MKIVCISNIYNDRLTINKVYDTIDDNHYFTTHYRIMNDFEKIVFCNRYYFITLDEFRNNIIDMVL